MHAPAKNWPCNAYSGVRLCIACTIETAEDSARPVEGKPFLCLFFLVPEADQVETTGKNTSFSKPQVQQAPRKTELQAAHGNPVRSLALA